jgi:AraC-like DNA-binding protein
MLSAAHRDDPAIPRGLFIGTLASLRMLDVDVEAALAKLGVGIDKLQQLPRRLPPAAMYDLWEAVWALSSERGYGVRIAERLRTDQLATFGAIVATSSTLGDALTRGLRLFRLLSETVHLSVDLGARQSVFTVHALHDKLHPESAEFLLASSVSFARQLSTQYGGPLEVRFTHRRPADPSYVERFFGCPVRFETLENGYTFDTAVLSAPVIGHDPERCAALQREAETLLADLTEPGAFRRDVVSAISAEIADGDPSVERVAARLGLHPKTLARRLSNDGTSYRQLLDEVRLRLARRYLEQPGISIAEIAFRLAYSEKSAFNRAFKRWTGQAPESFRRG